MATQNEQVAIGVLQNDMKEVKADIHELKVDVKTGFKEIKDHIAKFDETYARKSDLRQFKWATVPLVIIVTALISGFVAYFFATIGNKPSSNNPTTGQTTTTNTPTGSTSTTTTRDTRSTTPGARAEANAQAGEEKDSQTSDSNDGGGVNIDLPKVGL